MINKYFFFLTHTFSPVPFARINWVIVQQPNVLKPQQQFNKQFHFWIVDRKEYVVRTGFLGWPDRPEQEEIFKGNG